MLKVIENMLWLLKKTFYKRVKVVYQDRKGSRGSLMQKLNSVSGACQINLMWRDQKLLVLQLVVSKGGCLITWLSEYSLCHVRVPQERGKYLHIQNVCTTQAKEPGHRTDGKAQLTSPVKRLRVASWWSQGGVLSYLSILLQNFIYLTYF